MDTWVWLTVIGVAAVVLFALAWRSSGRSRARRIDTQQLSQEQRAGFDANRIATSRNREGLGGGPTF